MIIGQDTETLGEQTDIITALTCRDTVRDYVGPQVGNYQALVAQLPQLYGGNVAGIAGPAALGGNTLLTSPYWFQNFQNLGKLADVWNPITGGQDLRWEVNAQPSVVGGAGTSRINTLLMQLQKIENRTTDASFPY
jgi:hypothetical protein